MPNVTPREMFTLIRLLASIALLMVFVASQLFWIGRLGEWLVKNQRLRRPLGVAAVALLTLLFVYNLPWGGRERGVTHLTLQAALLQAPFQWWVFGSVSGFAIIVLLSILDRLARGLLWSCRKLISLTARRRATQHPSAPSGGSRLGIRLRPDDPVEAPVSSSLVSPGRRRFLELTAVAVGSAPFVAGAYGLFYGRLNLETTRKRITLKRLPRAFEGFRIAQLSDLHIGPFMSDDEIRKYVDIANRFKADLVVLTGDYVTWDGTTQRAVVEALADLTAPHGVFGCLGNHELWTKTEDSITRLFATRGIRILRQARASIQVRDEALNLIGVDFQTRSYMGRHGEGFVREHLPGVERLVLPDTPNILLSHNPNTFDRAAHVGIDLSLAGHTHGGQVALEFVHPDISPSRLITPYVRGWFAKGNAQLYVNRGIGTIGVPIRVGAPPEITVFELVRES